MDGCGDSPHRPQAEPQQVHIPRRGSGGEPPSCLPWLLQVPWSHDPGLPLQSQLWRVTCVSHRVPWAHGDDPGQSPPLCWLVATLTPWPACTLLCQVTRPTHRLQNDEAATCGRAAPLPPPERLNLPCPRRQMSHLKLTAEPQGSCAFPGELGIGPGAWRGMLGGRGRGVCKEKEEECLEGRKEQQKATGAGCGVGHAV